MRMADGTYDRDYCSQEVILDGVLDQKAQEAVLEK